MLPHPLISSSRFWRTLGIAACAAFAGCVSRQSSVKPTELLAGWKTEIERPRPGPVDLSGTYLNHGLFTGRNYAQTGKLAPGRLSGWMFELLEPRPPAADEVQLIQHGPELLECKLWRDGQVVWSTELTIEFDPKTGLVALPRQSRGVSRGAVLAAGGMTRRMYLLKGNDGCLYAHLESSGAGVALFIPFAMSADSWGQWKTSTPAALAEVKERERRKNAVQIGQPFPDFDTVDLDGQPVSKALLDGRVALVHFWSMAEKRSRDGLAELVKLYGVHHAAGLAIISICVDGAGEPEKFAAVVREQGLMWPQILDGEKSAGPLAQQFMLGSVPAVFLLDREGKIVLRSVGGTFLEKRLAALLAPPPP